VLLGVNEIPECRLAREVTEAPAGILVERPASIGVRCYVSRERSDGAGLVVRQKQGKGLLQREEVGRVKINEFRPTSESGDS
jgi:hypothetical protein